MIFSCLETSRQTLYKRSYLAFAVDLPRLRLERIFGIFPPNFSLFFAWSPPFLRGKSSFPLEFFPNKQFSLEQDAGFPPPNVFFSRCRLSQDERSLPDPFSIVVGDSAFFLWDLARSPEEASRLVRMSVAVSSPFRCA